MGAVITGGTRGFGFALAQVPRHTSPFPPLSPEKATHIRGGNLYASVETIMRRTAGAG